MFLNCKSSETANGKAEYVLSMLYVTVSKHDLEKTQGVCSNQEILNTESKFDFVSAQCRNLQDVNFSSTNINVSFLQNGLQKHI